MDNRTLFELQLEQEYARLFTEDPEYTFVAKRMPPAALAEKMTASLAVGTANKDGEGIKRACKKLGIPYTAKAIKTFLNAATVAEAVK